MTIQNKPDTQPTADRSSLLALWGGVAFSALFTWLIWALSPLLAGVPHAPDTGPLHYYWIRIDPDWISRGSVWGLYLLHQVSVWGLIYYAQTRVKRYTPGLHKVNAVALAVNALFVVLHLVQTHLWYDGLAQDVSILSSQGSVIVLLVLVLVMENPRRGLFFGRKAPLGQEAVRLVRKYHGYFFAWATIYTFWYHPMEATSGHLVGFFYTFLLMLQGSLFLTRLHVNRFWMLAQEVTVLIHGTLVAIMQGNGIWPMFAFGFGGIFVITQMHGLGLSRSLRAVILAVYCAAAVWVYSTRGLAQLNEIIRIPLIDYVLVFALAWSIGGALWLIRRIQALFRPQPGPSDDPNPARP